MIPQLVSLVKYDNPTLVSTTKDKRGGKDKTGKKVLLGKTIPFIALRNDEILEEILSGDTPKGLTLNRDRAKVVHAAARRRLNFVWDAVHAYLTNQTPCIPSLRRPLPRSRVFSASFPGFYGKIFTCPFAFFSLHSPILTCLFPQDLPPVEQKPGLTQTEDILNSILPPREWTEDGQLWVQYVSSTPATRLDVINLQEKLDQELQRRQARETGICPVREELYAQCFDELIRQVTINCAERGLLLLRVRDEMRMTIAAYQTLYESSVAFGMRKALQTEQGKSDMETRIQGLEADCKDYERQVNEWRMKCEAIEKRENERREADAKKHKEEVTYLENHTKQLKQQLEAFLAPGKK